MSKPVRICIVVTALWIVCAGGVLLAEYFRLGAQRELPYGVRAPPVGYVLEPKINSVWFYWQLPPNPKATYRPVLSPHTGRIASLLIIPSLLVWVLVLGLAWIGKSPGKYVG